MDGSEYGDGITKAPIVIDNVGNGILFELNRGQVSLKQVLVVKKLQLKYSILSKNNT